MYAHKPSYTSILLVLFSFTSLLLCVVPLKHSYHFTDLSGSLLDFFMTNSKRPAWSIYFIIPAMITRTITLSSTRINEIELSCSSGNSLAATTTLIKITARENICNIKMLVVKHGMWKPGRGTKSREKGKPLGMKKDLLAKTSTIQGVSNLPGIVSHFQIVGMVG